VEVKGAGVSIDAQNKKHKNFVREKLTEAGWWKTVTQHLREKDTHLRKEQRPSRQIWESLGPPLLVPRIEKGSLILGKKSEPPTLKKNAQVSEVG